MATEWTRSGRRTKSELVIEPEGRSWFKQPRRVFPLTEMLRLPAIPCDSNFCGNISSYRAEWKTRYAHNTYRSPAIGHLPQFNLCKTDLSLPFPRNQKRLRCKTSDIGMFNHSRSDRQGRARTGLNGRG